MIGSPNSFQWTKGEKFDDLRVFFRPLQREGFQFQPVDLAEGYLVDTLLWYNRWAQN